MSVAFRGYVPHPVNAAFGRPGATPHWASGAKDCVGTALGESSKVWFTMAGGILTEVCYPTVDTANSRDLRFYVSDSKTFFDEEGTDTDASLEYIDNRAPAFQITNTAKSGAYRIVKRVFTDPEANSLVMHTSFKPLKGAAKDYRLYFQFAPHIKNRGYGNSGRCADYNGETYLIAWRDDISAALTSDIPFLKMSAGYSGVTDGWHDLRDNYAMDWEFDYASDGNIALTAEVPAFTDFTLVLSFGRDEVEAVLESAKTLSRSIRAIEREYIREWHRYLHGLGNLSRASLDNGRRYHASAMVLKAHEDKTYKGGIVTSLAAPWGEARGDGEPAGYRLVQPGDLAKTAFALIAMEDMTTAVASLNFLRNTQNEDGSWPEYMRVDGSVYPTPSLRTRSLAHVSQPIMLAWRLKKAEEIGDEYYPMVKKAASYILRHGPVSEQDEITGISPSLLASEVSALVCAAEWAKEVDIADAEYIFSTADSWAASIEERTFIECKCAGEASMGHYITRVKSAPECISLAEALPHALVHSVMRADPPHQSNEVLDAGFLDLARYGVRDPGDPRILSSIAAVDGRLRYAYPGGAAFYRSSKDGYGEREDGSPFDGSGIGRPWPLLAGERGVFEAASGNGAATYLESLEGFAGNGLMYPEQVWDRTDMPERALFTGRSTGSAAPFVPAHAEYIKLLRAKKEKRSPDLIDEVRKRYVKEKARQRTSAWKGNDRISSARASDVIRISSHKNANLLWTDDGWRTKSEVPLRDSGFGIFYIDFKPDTFRPGTTLTFTFHYTEPEGWEGMNYDIGVD